MKVVILCGGRGERLGGLSDGVPKPLVEIGGRPILWHIMAGYAHCGFRDFILCAGYRGDQVARYFAEGGREPGWSVLLVDTGELTQTGGRLLRIKPLLSETFMMTWCDGVSDVNIPELLAFHRSHGKLATVTAVHPPPRFGSLALDGDRVASFAEKPPTSREWVNGAFFVLEPAVLQCIEGDGTQWEYGPMEYLARSWELMAFRHEGFWQCMDTQQDRRRLERMWSAGEAPWKTWVN